MGAFVNGMLQSSDLATQELLRNLIANQTNPSWHDLWYGKIIIGVVSGVIGGLIVKFSDKWAIFFRKYWKAPRT